MTPSEKAPTSSTPKAPKVVYRHNVAKGVHEVGVKIGKLFIPFASHDDARFAQLEENAQNLADDNDNADDEDES
jgi:hypothetical protein